MNDSHKFEPPKGKADAINEATGPCFVNMQPVAVGVYTPDKKKVYVESWSARNVGKLMGSTFMVRGNHYLTYAGFGGPLTAFHVTQQPTKPLANGAHPNPAIPGDGNAPQPRSIPLPPPSAPAAGTPPPGADSEGAGDGGGDPADEGGDGGSEGDEGSEGGSTEPPKSTAPKPASAPKPGSGLKKISTTAKK